jgi:(p)ppGpp synthase/HD superfamily hydrolase
MSNHLLSKAIQIAAKAHDGQTDKSGMPYISHVLRVMEAGKTIDEKIVGVLHDIVEDTDWTLEQLEHEGFPLHIVEAIRCLTKTSEDEDYFEFIERVKSNPLAIQVKINDLTDNMDIRRLEQITDNDVERLRKYRAAYKMLTAL